MSCMDFIVTPSAPAVLDVTPLEGASLTVEPVASVSLDVTPAGPVSLDVTPKEGASLAVTPQSGCELTIGEVCGVTPGTIVVLAASDGPLRTKDGGYLLLDPTTNPPEN